MKVGILVGKPEDRARKSRVGYVYWSRIFFLGNLFFFILSYVINILNIVINNQSLEEKICIFPTTLASTGQELRLSMQ